jgi:ubiquinone biosynthesis protein UbiJ
MRPPGSHFAVLGRVIRVTNPPDLVALSHSGEISVLDDLIGLLGDPSRAWAAVVLLAAMTGHDAEIVGSFATEPDRWWKELGGTAAERWSRWLAEHRATLIWDADTHRFVERG